MANDHIQQLVVRAIQQAYDEWARQHPSLAAVIDRITLTEHAVESLRASDEFKKAVAEYHKSSVELQLLDRLTEIAKPILAAILVA